MIVITCFIGISTDIYFLDGHANYQRSALLARYNGPILLSSAFIKIWRFLWPPRVQIEFVFEQQQYADILAENLEKFTKITRSKRVINGRAYPSIRVDWEFWYSIKMAAGAPIDPPDIIAQNYLRQKNKRKALEELARDTILFMATMGIGPTFVEEDEGGRSQNDAENQY